MSSHAVPAGPMRTTARPEPNARFVDLLAAEWIKLWSLRSIPYGLLLLIAVVVGININGSRADYAAWPRMSPGERANFYALKDAFSNSSFLILMLGAGSIGAIVVVSEYSSGLIRTTFSAVPARMSVILAKVIIVAAVFTVVGAIIAGFAFGVSQSILDGRGVGLSISHPGVLRAAIGSALLAPVCALTGMALGALIRHSATTIVVTTALLLVVPNFFDDRRSTLDAFLAHSLPYGAWTRLVNIDPQNKIPGDYVATVSQSFIMLGVWAAVATIVALVAVRRRDV
jgi:ABC-type transport system involved in multi-copper enzyme maturation permease subunit